jgi:hypothetical protein
LKEAGGTLDQMRVTSAVDVEEVVAEFDAMRKKAREPVGSQAA